MERADIGSVVCAVDANLGGVQIGSDERRALSDRMRSVQNLDREFLRCAKCVLPQILRVGLSVQDDRAVGTEDAVFMNVGLRRTRGDEEEVGCKARGAEGRLSAPVSVSGSAFGSGAGAPISCD